jgi:hypothetical protein
MAHRSLPPPSENRFKPSSLLDVLRLLCNAAVVEMVMDNPTREDTPWGEAARQLHDCTQTIEDLFGKETT